MNFFYADSDVSILFGWSMDSYVSTHGKHLRMKQAATKRERLDVFIIIHRMANGERGHNLQLNGLMFTMWEHRFLTHHKNERIFLTSPPYFWVCKIHVNETMQSNDEPFSCFFSRCNLLEWNHCKPFGLHRKAKKNRWRHRDKKKSHHNRRSDMIKKVRPATRYLKIVSWPKVVGKNLIKV